MGDIDISVIKKTQESLGKYVKKPPLSEKLLRKPPFRFLHDIIHVIIKDTGYLKGLYSADELKSETIKEREDKILFLQSLIDVVKSSTGENLTVRPSKIIAGQEPQKTNELLQAIARAVDKKVDASEIIMSMKNAKTALPVNATTKAKREKIMSIEKDVKNLKTVKTKIPIPAAKEVKTTERLSKEKKPVITSRSSKEKIKQNAEKHVPEKKILEKSLSQEKKFESSENKESKQIIETTDNGIKISSITSVFETKPEIKPITPPQIVKISVAPDLEKKPSSSKKNIRHFNSGIQKEESEDDRKITTVENEMNDFTSNSELATQPIEENSSSKGMEESVLPQSPEKLAKKEKPKSPEQELKSKKYASPTEKQGNFIQNNISKEQKNLYNSNENKNHKLSENSQPSYIRRKSGDQRNYPPRTTLRPPSVRPASARPGAPRRRDKNVEIILQPEEMVKLGEIKVKIDTSELEDDGENLIIIEDPETQNTKDELLADTYTKNDNNVKQQGHLVQQILDTQKEFKNTVSVDEFTPSENSWNQPRKSSAVQVNSLRDALQKLTRSINPLGKLLDFLQEDIDSMDRELEKWKENYKQTKIELIREKGLNDNAIEPMKHQLAQIEINIKEHIETINTSRANILQNENKILKLLTDY